MNMKAHIHTKIPQEYKDMVEKRLAEFDSWNPTDQRYILREVGVISNRDAFWQEILIFAIEEFCKQWDKQVKPGHPLYPLIRPITFKRQTPQGNSLQPRPAPE